MEKIGKYNSDKVFKRIYELSEDPHNNYTPLELCDEMLDKVLVISGNMDILVMFNLEFVYKIKHRINNLDRVWFLTPCENKAAVAEAMGVNRNHIRFYSYKEKEPKGIEDMPKFDVVVGNPPYLRGGHLNFLEKAYNISKRFLVFIQPATWVLNDTPSCIRIKNLVGPYVKSIRFLDGNPEFGIIMASPLSITFIDKDNKNDYIKVNDPINNKEYTVDQIDLINKWSNTEIYPELKNKIKNISEKENDNFSNTEQRHKKSKYYIVISRMRGNTDFNTPNKLIKPDFYTLLGKSDRIKNSLSEKDLKNKNQNWYGFNSIVEAKNCFEFLKTKWARFCLSINKSDKALQKSEVKNIPWLDWSEPWPEERFEKLINATPEEIAFVKENIPDYYNI